MMRRLRRAAEKLRARELDALPHELRVRGGQWLAAWRERRGLRDRELATSDAALARRLAPGVSADAGERLALFRDRLRARGVPRFFPGLADRAATVAALRAHAPADEADVLRRAERLLAGRFDLLGYRDLDWGTPIDWMLDPVSGRRAPVEHWSRVPYLDPAAVGDHKVVWEVNRHQWFVTLGQAYWYSGDERFAARFAATVSAWMDANPPKRGINWASSLEVAFRAISWLWALHFFADTPALTPALHARMLDFLHVHARHLETYLSTYFSPNTHLTGEALGLVFIGTYVPELAGAARWRAIGERILREQADRQVRPDGVYFEQASQYQRYTTEFYLQLVLLLEAESGRRERGLRAVVDRSMTHLRHLARPDGTIPLLGDDDGGRLVQLDGRTPDDVRALLATGAVVLDRPDLRSVGPEDAAPVGWLLGPDGLARLAAMPPAVPEETSRAFADGGFYTMRDGWGPTADHGVIDCGPHGVFNCGHAHADVLAVTLSVDGRPLFVDAGTFTYPGVERNAFRGAAAHNTLTLDGEGSSVPATGAFQWERVAHGRPLSWVAGDRFDLFEGTHDGFAALAAPASHVRTVLRLGSLGWVVRDRVDGAARHRAAVRWHLAPGLACRHRADATPSGAVFDITDESGTIIAHLAVVGERLDVRLEDGWASPGYGAREPAVVVVAEQEAAGPQEIATVVTPARVGLEPAAPFALLAKPAGAADTSEFGLVLLRPDVHALSGIATDAELSCVRYEGDAPVWAFAVGGTYLTVTGSDILSRPSGTVARDWRSAERRAEGWRVDRGALGAAEQATGDRKS